MSIRKGIYFCGSMRAGRQDVDLYSIIIQKLSSYGEVLTPFVGDKSITECDSEYEGGDKVIHDQAVGQLEKASVIVAEVTQPSLGVGYEIGRAYAMKKPILCLYRPQPEKKLSAMIAGMDDTSQNVVVKYKSSDELDKVFEKFMKLWM